MTKVAYLLLDHRISHDMMMLFLVNHGTRGVMLKWGISKYESNEMGSYFETFLRKDDDEHCLTFILSEHAKLETQVLRSRQGAIFVQFQLKKLHISK